MTTQTLPETDSTVYPDSDGKRMADNTVQYNWIVTLQANLDALFEERGDVFVAADLLWYTTQGHPEICVAPDVLIAFGRPGGDRGSYKQWKEDGIAPQVVFEVLSPSNTKEEMERKLQFYEDHGVEEYYVLDPDDIHLDIYCRDASDRLAEVSSIADFVSPRTGIRFEVTAEKIIVRGPDGKPFETIKETRQRASRSDRQAATAKRGENRAKREKAAALAEAEREKAAALAEAERQKTIALAEAERQKTIALAEAEREKAAALAEAERQKTIALAAEREKAAADAKAERLAALLRSIGHDAAL